MFKIECTCPDKDKKQVPKYLGGMRVDVANTARFHCKNCNVTWEYICDGFGRIVRRKLDSIKLSKITCESCKKRYDREVFLGNIQVGIQNVAHFHCKNCNTTYEVSYSYSGGVGGISVKPISGIVAYEPVPIIGD
jgi:transposase-like protein